MKEKPTFESRKKPAAQEMTVTVHHREDGPSLESCMIAVLSCHMPERRAYDLCTK